MEIQSLKINTAWNPIYLYINFVQDFRYRKRFGYFHRIFYGYYCNTGYNRRLVALCAKLGSMAGVPPTKVKTISNDTEFKTELGVAGDTLVVVEFTATW